MKNRNRVLLGSWLGFAFALATPAQEMPAPKVLQITREYVKPGKRGTSHDKAESAFVKAMSDAKWPTYYVALSSLSGKLRVLFLTSYASYDAWQKDSDAIAKNAPLIAALDQAVEGDGELLDSVDQGVFLFQEDMSLRAHPDLSQFRYMEISSYEVRPGHMEEWSQLVKMAKAAYEKGVPDAHWGMFEQRYGGGRGTYLVFTGLKSLSEIDQTPMQDMKFAGAMGEAGLKVFNDLYKDCVESSQYQLFAVSPQMSYVPESWKKADPDFWAPKAMIEAAKPAKDKKAKK